MPGVRIPGAGARAANQSYLLSMRQKTVRRNVRRFRKGENEMNELMIFVFLAAAAAVGLWLTQVFLWCCYRHFGGKLSLIEWSRAA